MTLSPYNEVPLYHKLLCSHIMSHCGYMMFVVSLAKHEEGMILVKLYILTICQCSCSILWSLKLNFKLIPTHKLRDHLVKGSQTEQTTSWSATITCSLWHFWSLSFLRLITRPGLNNDVWFFLPSFLQITLWATLTEGNYTSMILLNRHSKEAVWLLHHGQSLTDPILLTPNPDSRQTITDP